MSQRRHLSIVAARILENPVHRDPKGPADEELEWFFARMEGDVGVRSNYTDSLVWRRHRPDDLDVRIDAAHARRVILERLRKVGDPDAGVLEAAYATRAWPARLSGELHRLTGIVVRLAAAEIGMPERDVELDLLEQRSATHLATALTRSGARALDKIRRKAQRHFDRAYGSYLRERGVGRSLVASLR